MCYRFSHKIGLTSSYFNSSKKSQRMVSLICLKIKQPTVNFTFTYLLICSHCNLHSLAVSVWVSIFLTATLTEGVGFNVAPNTTAATCENGLMSECRMALARHCAGDLSVSVWPKIKHYQMSRKYHTLIKLQRSSLLLTYKYY